MSESEQVRNEQRFERCSDCVDVGGTLTSEEYQRRCQGPKKMGELAVAMCGKKIPPTRGEDMYPQLWKIDY